LSKKIPARLGAAPVLNGQFKEPFDNDPANDRLRGEMWELQEAITRELKWLDNKISDLETAPPTLESDYDTREKDLVKHRRERNALKAAEAEYLAAPAHKLPSVVKRLKRAYPHLMTPSEPAAKPKAKRKSLRRVPQAKLQHWWFKVYLPEYPDPEKRPNVEAQHKAAIAHFKSYEPPSRAETQQLRADKRTPDEWRKPGTRPKSN
jgi:hypothetical protein